MSLPALSTVVSTWVFALLSVCFTGRLPALEEPLPARERPVIEDPRCPFGTRHSQLPTRAVLDSRPQSPLYRGGCLEHIVFLKGSLKDGMFSNGQAEAFFRRNPSTGVRPSASVRLMRKSRYTLHKVNSWLTAYEVTFEGTNLCAESLYQPGAEGELAPEPPSGTALLIPGYWDESDGIWRAQYKGENVFTAACYDGTVAKCAHWGYVPWGTYAGKSLQPYHQACVPAARAEYDHVKAYTCANTAIDIFDNLGLLRRSEDSGFSFESRWNAKGLKCVARPRWKGCETDLAGVLGVCEEPVLGQSWGGDLIGIRSSADRGLQNFDSVSSVSMPFLCPVEGVEDVGCQGQPD
ncbi:ADYC domain-containing protein [Stigmatella sp. ncwal1]|uniref:ADYC domain-containing protein n=1 Tax=Stigmatella ashevillensis TaxID=2995309 RepID=A0ABT5DF86_9BACT|nr:ADYC domain-containing protein [Stigmatella ashevillena]MDC0711744.1 ADYC domain-containing protein [Stigmatella ashevillena]